MSHNRHPVAIERAATGNLDRTTGTKDGTTECLAMPIWQSALVKVGGYLQGHLNVEPKRVVIKENG